jgi:hypothetical protein
MGRPVLLEIWMWNPFYRPRLQLVKEKENNVQANYLFIA